MLVIEDTTDNNLDKLHALFNFMFIYLINCEITVSL